MITPSNQPGMLSDAKAAELVDLINAGHTPLDLRKHFGSFREAVRFYAEVRGSQFGLGSSTEKCCGCGKPADGLVAEINWGWIYTRHPLLWAPLILLGMLIHIHLHPRSEVIGFSTVHGFCPSCWKKARRATIWSGVVEAITLVSVFGGLAFGAGFVAAIFVLDRLTSTDKLELWLASAGSILVFLFGVALKICARQLAVPPPIRYIAPRPFRPLGMSLMMVMSVPSNPSVKVQVPRYSLPQASGITWQQTLIVLLTLLVLVPGVIIAFAADEQKSTRTIGYEMMGVAVPLLVILILLQVSRGRKIRAAYYSEMAERINRG